ncbi:MAG: hypothetical protein HQL82_17100 [Magnetococcales bacterium]|nr:hypothetical protein [Magnetococcales bacterium]
MIRLPWTLAGLLWLSALAGCVYQPHSGMILHEESGIAYGSRVSETFFTDPETVHVPNIKLTLRNLSGDGAFDLGEFRARLTAGLQDKGWKVEAGRPFGIKLDIAVLYSGAIHERLTSRFAILGATGGYAGGLMAKGQTAAQAGMAVGAGIGAILGTYVTDDTYIVVTEVTLGLTDRRQKKTSDISFGEPPRYEDPEEETEWQERRQVTRFRKIHKITVASYAGGRIPDRQQVVQGVRERLATILADVI